MELKLYVRLDIGFAYLPAPHYLLMLKIPHKTSMCLKFVP